MQSIPDGTELALRLVPNGSKCEIVGRYGDAVKVRVQSPPLDGKANKELTGFLAKKLGVSNSCVKIARGAKSRNKTIHVYGLKVATVEGRLKEDLA